MKTKTMTDNEIYQLNAYTIEINGKLVFKSIDRNVWISDDDITLEEFGILNKYLDKNFKSKLEI